MKLKIFHLTFIILIIISGCVYYNTFYNAKNYFDEAKAKSLKDNGRPSPQAISLYNKSMKKCGIILTDYKDSKYSDDALFLLAKCLYNKQNYMLAKEQFENFLKKYPQNELCPEAILYSAKSDFFLGNKQEAFTRLEEFLLNDKMKKFHPKAYLVLSEYYFHDKLYYSSVKYLQELIKKYPDSEEYEEAFFRLGEIYNIAKDYEKSSKEFKKFLKHRFSRNKKLDARYYIAYNNIMFDKADLALKQIKKLLKDEYREDKIPRIKLIEARANAKLGNYKKAETEFDNIIKDNPRKKIAASASYFLGEMYFRKLHDYEKAITYFNKVKTNYRKSEYITKALEKSTIASQILQYNSSDNKDVNTEKLVSQSFKLADHYLNILNLPDSSLTVYNQIIKNDSLMKLKIDSLKTQISDISDSTDSLIVAHRDSLKTSLTKFSKTLNLYENQFVPFANFLKLWIYKNVKNDTVNANKTFEILQKQFPENKYYFAAKKVMENQKVDEIISPQEKALKEKYDAIISQSITKPDSSIIQLKALDISQDSDIYWKKIFSLGYIYYFDLKDTSSAKPYFNQLLERNSEDDYSKFIKNFYDGKSFTITDSLEYLNKLLREEKAKADTTKKDEK